MHLGHTHGGEHEARQPGTAAEIGERGAAPWQMPEELGGIDLHCYYRLLTEKYGFACLRCRAIHDKYGFAKVVSSYITAS
jgi:hypothetical protein